MRAPPATEHPAPSAARELVRGAYDLHVHVEPDLAKRRIDDLSLARRFAELGLAGFVLKSHYVPTAERAAVVRAAVPGHRCAGRDRAQRGRRRPQRAGGRDRGARRRADRLAAHGRLRERGRRGRPEAGQAARVAQDPGRVRGRGRGRRAGARDAGRRSRRCSTVVARHGLVLATGHLGRAEIHLAVDQALAAGVATRRRHAPRLPDPGRAGRRAARAGGAGRAARALLRADPHRQGLLGGDVRGDPRDGRRPSTCSRPISARSRTRRSRTASR